LVLTSIRVLLHYNVSILLLHLLSDDLGVNQVREVRHAVEVDLVLLLGRRVFIVIQVVALRLVPASIALLLVLLVGERRLVRLQLLLSVLEE
jgi:hypothetical protein